MFLWAKNIKVTAWNISQQDAKLWSLKLCCWFCSDFFIKQSRFQPRNSTDAKSSKLVNNWNKENILHIKYLYSDPSNAKEIENLKYCLSLFRVHKYPWIGCANPKMSNNMLKGPWFCVVYLIIYSYTWWKWTREDSSKIVKDTFEINQAKVQNRYILEKSTKIMNWKVESLTLCNDWSC